MKKKLIFIILLIFLIPCSANAFLGAHVVGTPKVLVAIETYIETLDGASSCISGGVSNCDNVDLFFTNNGCTLNSTNGVPDDTYQLEIPSESNVFWDCPDYDESWMTFRIRTEVDPTTNTYEITMKLFDTATNTLAQISWVASTDKARARVESNTIGDCTTVMSEDTFYWWKFRYKKDTGAANAEFQLWVSTDGTTWTDSVSGSADNTDESQLTKIRFYNDYTDANSAFYIDNIQFSNADITDAT